MIRATFAGFNIAASGMAAAQRALDVTGNNMSNMDTIGFTRQRLDLNSIPSMRHSDRFAGNRAIDVGNGVRMVQVAQLRDPHLDRRFRNEASTIGEMDAHFSVMNSMARIFDEIQFEQGLFRAMQDFRTQLQRYSTQTGEVTLDATVASSAQGMLRMFQMYAIQIQAERDYQESLLFGHNGSLTQINAKLENIALLNKHIRDADIVGNPALELRDQRNLLIDQLSAHIRIEVHHTPDPALPGVDILSITFLEDNNLPPNYRTLVDGMNYTNLRHGRDSDGRIFVFKDTPQPNNVTGQRNRIDDPGAGTFAHLDVDPMIGGVSHADWQAFWNTHHPGENPLTAVTIDPNAIAWQNHWNTYFGDIMMPTAHRDPFAYGTALDFRTGAIRGALDMLNSRGAFDDPPNSLNGIGYYERILDQIVNDFATQFNIANQAANPLLPILNSHLEALIAHPAAVDAHATAWSDFWNYLDANPIHSAALTAAGIMAAPTSDDDRQELLDFAAYHNIPLPSAALTAAPPAPPATPTMLTQFFEEMDAYVNALPVGFDFDNDTPPAPSAFLAQFFNHDLMDLRAFAQNWEDDFGDGLDAHLASLVAYAADPSVSPPPSLPLAELVSRPLFESDDGGPITARNIMIATGWDNGTYMLTTTRLTGQVDSETGDFSGDTSNLLYMINLFERSFNFTSEGIGEGGTPLFTSNFLQMFRIIGLNAASDTSAIENALWANTNVIRGIESMRDSISSVSMDEEAINLLRFQKSYAASARVMTTLDEALDILINRTGIVGR